MPDRLPSQIKKTKSETLRFPPVASSFPDRLLRVQDRDLCGLAQECQEAHQRREKAVLQARYEDAGIAVELIHAIRGDRHVRDRFNDAFEKDLRREPKAGNLNREVFLFLYGEARKGMAGTDAMSLTKAIERRVPAHEIPAYIKAQGGLQKLLRAERRRRDPLVLIRIHVRTSVLKRLDDLTLGGRADAVVMRSTHENPATSKYAITQLIP